MIVFKPSIVVCMDKLMHVILCDSLGFIEGLAVWCFSLLRDKTVASLQVFQICFKGSENLFVMKVNVIR